MRILLLLLLLLSFCQETLSQWKFQSYQEIPLSSETDKTKLYPWAGGLNGVQYSQLDLNNDEQADIVAFDRASGRTLCFIKSGNTFTYAPQYEPFFPEEISNFLIIKDYDQDGKADIFTAGNLGIVAFRNISSGQIPEWEKTVDFLTYESLSGNLVNLQVNFNDYPFIGDIDDDGDLDIFNFNFSGLESEIIFFKNESVETGSTPDINNFRVADNFWGQVEDCDCGVFAFGEEECNSPFGRDNVGDFARHAGGKSILIHDFKGDGKLELVTSHEECRELYAFLQSETSGIFPDYNSFTTIFPSAENPAKFNFYPSAMLLDLDQDGQQEIVISPNLEGDLGSPVNFSSSNWLYEPADSGYQLTTKAFLQEDMIDWGSQASPAFYDFDEDGDQDLFIAYTDLDESGELFSAIAHYENTGAAGSPRFNFLTDDFLNISSIGLANMLMQWKDIDKDGNIDLSLQGTLNNSNQLYFIFNDNGTLDINQRQEITDANIGFGFSVHLADVSGTDAVDVLVGKSSGGLILYENSGSGRNPNFIQNSSQFLGIGDDFFRSSLKVYVDDIDNDGKKDLLASDLSGIIKIYPDVRNNTGESDTLLLHNSLSNTFQAFNFGKRNLLTTAKIFDDAFPSVILGGVSGGLRITRNIQEFPVQTGENAKIFIVYPNPNTSRLLQINTNEDVHLSIITTSGKRVKDDFFYNADSGTGINISGLSAGVYIVTARFADGTEISRKLVVE